MNFLELLKDSGNKCVICGIKMMLDCQKVHPKDAWMAHVCVKCHLEKLQQIEEKSENDK